MVTESSRKLLSEEHGFLVGITRRQNPEAEAFIDRVDESKMLSVMTTVSVAYAEALCEQFVFKREMRYEFVARGYNAHYVF